ncbi:MAG: CopD family protein [Anaerolineales bacterium]
MNRLIALMAGAAIAFAVAAPVRAHALFVRSDPTPNAILAAAPAQVEIWLTEPVELGFTSIKVLASNGERVDVGTTSIDPSDPGHIFVGLRSLADGVYTVSWQALSVVDGHITLGTFPFAVGGVEAGALAAAGTVSTSVVAANPGEIVPRWLALLGLALVVGGFIFRAYVWTPALADAGRDVPGTDVNNLFDNLRTAGFALFLAANIGALLWQVTLATGLPTLRALFDPSMADLLFGARFGLLWLVRITLVLVLAIRNPGWERWLEYARPVAAAGVLFSIALGSHPAAALKPFFPVLAMWVHLAMAIIWLGGLAHLLVGLVSTREALRPTRLQFASALVPRFSNLGLATMGLLVVTGVFNATVTVVSWDALFGSDYGRALLIKLALLAPLLALATVNILILRPQLRLALSETESDNSLVRQLRRTVAGEVFFGVGLVLLASIFASTPPAESLRGKLTFDARAEDLQLDLELRPGAIGVNEFSLNITDTDGQPVTNAREVALRFTPLSGELAPSELALAAAGDGRYIAEGSNLSMPGEWQVQVVVRREAEFDAFANIGVRLNAPGQSGSVANRLRLFRYTAVVLYGCAIVYLLAMQGLTRSQRQQNLLGLLPALALGLTGIGVLRVGNAQARAELARVNPIPPSQESIAIGESIYTQSCSPCHGPTGLGDGPAGLLLNPPPANMQEHMVPGLHTDGQIFEWITDGYPASAMPAFGDTISVDNRWNVINYIRTLVPEEDQ